MLSTLQPGNRDLIEYYFTDTYHLTSAGWRKGIHLLGLCEDISFRQKLSQLCATLKDQVKGRHDEAYPHVSHAAETTGLTEELIVNGAEWAHGDRGKFILIPNDFGIKPL